MRWARATGLVTPDSCVLPIEKLQGVDPSLLAEPSRGEASRGEPSRAFAIKRFDRDGGDRIHQEDFAQALDLRPNQKYGENSSGVIYDGLTRFVADLCGESARDDFIARLAFVVASGNDDAHLKNWSFQWGHAHRPSLSPCHDLVATISWPDFGWAGAQPPRLALSLGIEKSLDEMDRRALQKFARRTGFDGAVDVFMAALQRARNA